MVNNPRAKLTHGRNVQRTLDAHGNQVVGEKLTHGKSRKRMGCIGKPDSWGVALCIGNILESGTETHRDGQ